MNGLPSYLSSVLQGQTPQTQPWSLIDAIQMFFRKLRLIFG